MQSIEFGLLPLSSMNDLSDLHNTEYRGTWRRALPKLVADCHRAHHAVTKADDQGALRTELKFIL